MRPRIWALAIFAVTAAACGAGSSGPPGLAYEVPEMVRTSYSVGDTLLVDIDAMGQSLQLTQAATAMYGLAFERAAEGMSVTLTVDEMSSVVNQPMGAPVRTDQDDVQGPLVFTLDRLGNATVVATPEVSEEASQSFSALATAHGFFPGLPGTAMAEGASWVDTVRFEGEEGPGEISQLSILTYTVVGADELDGRAVVRIEVEGTREVSQTGSVQGMDVYQTANVDVEGHVLWDLNRGMLVESHTRESGRGSIEVAVAPQPLSIRLRAQSWTRLQDM